MTAPAHVLVFRPVIERLRARGHEVVVTARDYSQTLDLLRMHGIEATAFGRHGGASRAEKAMALARRTRAMRRFGADRHFDLDVVRRLRTRDERHHDGAVVRRLYDAVDEDPPAPRAHRDLERDVVAPRRLKAHDPRAGR